MKKLREQGGYSLTESLCVVIVLLLITAVLMTGMRFATDTFAKSVSQSEAQVLCSTLKTVVTNELKNASEVKLDGRIWTARSLTGEPIPKGGIVIVREIRGVKLIVESVRETAVSSDK